MKVFASILTLTAIMASTVSGCADCHDCPGDQVCWYAPTHGTGGIGSCVEPWSDWCTSGNGFCDIQTCN
ncbi:hypothetical protein THARTR1_10055 [Trichoderma harzianum]|uniref:Uncharacterized protein n=1 Tax=Trichoderma harzianum TaxID=5544 RepID=A0A2K0TUN5_TRIHA|nr:hypothetical protein THARTR1_10055 [Trichoderma harzianum]